MKYLTLVVVILTLSIGLFESAKKANRGLSLVSTTHHHSVHHHDHQNAHTPQEPFHTHESSLPTGVVFQSMTLPAERVEFTTDHVQIIRFLFSRVEFVDLEPINSIFRPPILGA